jgi:fructose-1,6-bisphosphatase/inositol monophosphatase family enzyme
VRDAWPLPRRPEYFLDGLDRLQQRVRERLWRDESRDVEAASAATEAREGDTTFAIDLDAEEIVDRHFAAWGEELPLLLIAEGIGGDGGRTYPEGTARNRVAFTCIVDPIDGTRGLMYQKRSAWALAGIAPPPDKHLPGLNDICLAMQTELPTARSHLSDVLWAVRGDGAEGRTDHLEGGPSRPVRLRPSRASTLRHGFGTICKFFQGGKALTAEVEDRLFRAVLGTPPDGNPDVFDDEYISTGGQMYELMMGHDRFVADLRPLIFAVTGQSGDVGRLCSHPYDLATELIAREAGVIVSGVDGAPLEYPLDIRVDCAWTGYANDSLRAQIEPALRAILQDIGVPPHLLSPGAGAGRLSEPSDRAVRETDR